jgi:hypothetical protein
MKSRHYSVDATTFVGGERWQRPADPFPFSDLAVTGRSGGVRATLLLPSPTFHGELADTASDIAKR